MAYDTNISFHGVSRIEIGPVKSFTHEASLQPWESLTLWLYDAEGRLVTAVPIHSDDGQRLVVDFERKADAS